MCLLIMMIILMFYFILVKDPIAYEHDDFLYILGVSQLLMIYVYACLCWAWTMKHMIDEMFCVEQEPLEHMRTYIFVGHNP